MPHYQRKDKNPLPKSTVQLALLEYNILEKQQHFDGALPSDFATDREFNKKFRENFSWI